MDLLGNRPVLDTTRFINIQDFVRAGEQVPEGRMSPLQLADLLKENGEKVLAGVKGFRASDPMIQALEIELTDLEQLAWLQLFFAWRLEATLLLAEDIHRGTTQNSAQIDSHLARSLDCWREIIRLKERYNRETIPYLFNEQLNYRSYLELLEEEAKNYHQIKMFRTHDLN
jgi:hypothetical protein